MENTPRLYDALQALLGQHCRWRDQRHLYPLVWMVVGLVASGQISLTAWSDYVQSRAVYAQSTQRRFSRWLGNERVQEHALYARLIRYALSVWLQERLVLALDTTMLWERYCVIRVVIVYRGRAIPVVWKVLEHSSSMVAYAAYAPLLDAVVKVLPQGVEILFLADRGFDGCGVVQTPAPLRLALPDSGQVQLSGVSWQARYSGWVLHPLHQSCPVFAPCANHQSSLWFSASGISPSLSQSGTLVCRQ
ncbi:MAG: hypothetical protein HC899_40140 [Leptolyngbyaceae cyanobacterium SM1_4_3]|nr:hypothetical protein [Leptolyngbyaceae cyanobacterium SM1_4_3]